MTKRLIGIAAAFAVLSQSGTAISAESPAGLRISTGPTATATAPAQPVPLTAASPPAPTQPSESPAPAAAPRTKVIPLDPGAVMRRLPPQTSVADVPASGVVDLPINKTRPLDIAGEVSEIVVGSPEIADVLVRSPGQVFLMAKAVGHTNVFLLGRDGRLLRRIEVNVHQDVETLRQMLAQLLPDEIIDVTAFGDAITLSGTVRSDTVAQQARAIARRFVSADESLINMLNIAGESQVLLRVRMAEINRQVLKDLDVRFHYGPKSIGNIGIGGVAGTVGGVANSVGAVAGSAFAGGGGLGGAALGSLGIAHLTQPIALNIQALENEDLVKTLAEPTLTALSGERAEVFAGTQVPVVTYTTTNGITTATVEYVGAGISLAFVPVIVGPGRISLKIGAEASFFTGSPVAGTPFQAKSVRSANTSVELPSGGSMMIAGVLSNDVVTGLQGTPGLMDIPVLGSLFRSSRFERNESELVVTLEAFIVEPSEPTKLALPSDGFVPAGDLDRYLLGRLHRVYAKPDLPTGREPLQGPVGYIMH